MKTDNGAVEKDAETLCADYLAWVGQQTCAEDEITAAPLQALCAVLDRDPPVVRRGTVLPPLWHWMFFFSLQRSAQMRRDGAREGDLMPPIPLPRRMWAGSQFHWTKDNPLRVGDRVTRRSCIQSVTPKQGRSGELVFVRAVHDYYNDAGLSFSNAQDSVFRGEVVPGSAPPDPILKAQDAPWKSELVPDPILLFRYSALTFNPHRIHYDYQYATQVENHPNIVVQGPLIATLLLELLQREQPRRAVHSLQFKALRPAFAGRCLRLRGRPEEEHFTLWAENEQGQLAMTATAKLY